MSEKASSSMDYIHSIDYFLKKMIDPGEEFPADEKPVIKIDDFKTVFNLAQIEVFASESEYTNDMLLFLRILKNTAYYIIDEEIVSKLWKQSNQILNDFVADSKGEISPKVTIALEVFQSVS